MANLRIFETYVTQQGVQYVVSPITAQGKYSLDPNLFVGHRYLTIPEHNIDVLQMSIQQQVELSGWTIEGVPYTQEPNPYDSPGELPPEIPPEIPAEIEILRPDIYIPPVVSDSYVQPVPEKNLLLIAGIIILFIFMMR